MKRTILSIILGAILAVPLCIGAVKSQKKEPINISYSPEKIEVIPEEEQTPPEVTDLSVVEPIDVEEEIQEEKYEGELELLACLVQAEAGNQNLYGKRLVADVVFNRVASDQFPDTITDVIYQDNQFSTVDDGALERAFYTVTDDDYAAVSAELETRTDYQILYFTAGNYNDCGTPAYQYGAHYFSTK